MRVSSDVSVIVYCVGLMNLFSIITLVKEKQGSELNVRFIGLVCVSLLCHVQSCCVTGNCIQVQINKYCWRSLFKNWPIYQVITILL